MATKNVGDEAVAAVEALERAKADALTALRTSASEIEARIEADTENLKSITAKIRELDRASGRRRRRARNDETLVLAVARVFQDANGTLTPGEVAEAVKKSGYRSNSDGNFGQMVAQSLSTLKKTRAGRSPVLVNQERGQWAAGSGLNAFISKVEAEAKAEAEAAAA